MKSFLLKFVAPVLISCTIIFTFVALLRLCPSCDEGWVYLPAIGILLFSFGVAMALKRHLFYEIPYRTLLLTAVYASLPFSFLLGQSLASDRTLVWQQTTIFAFFSTLSVASLWGLFRPYSFFEVIGRLLPYLADRLVFAVKWLRSRITIRMMRRIFIFGLLFFIFAKVWLIPDRIGSCEGMPVARFRFEVWLYYGDSSEVNFNWQQIFDPRVSRLGQYGNIIFTKKLGGAAEYFSFAELSCPGGYEMRLRTN